jgi:hypothetical protein
MLIPPVTPHLVSLQVVNLFMYLHDKDLFAEIYRNQLAKRLLNQRSSSDDWEKLMIGKLKHRCGAQFTGKVRRPMHMPARPRDAPIESSCSSLITGPR